MKERELQFIEDTNKSSLQDMKSVDPDNSGHLKDAMVRGFERVFSLFMLVFKENGKAKRLTLKIAGVEFSGFDFRDVPRLMVVGGIAFLIYHKVTGGA